MGTAKKFYTLVTEEATRLEKLCVEWQNFLDTKYFPEDTQDQIRLVVGQTKLLLKEKFKQFKDLVIKFEGGVGDVVITSDDLEGFWDLIMIQINDLNGKFNILEKTGRDTTNGYVNGKVKH